MPGLIVGHVESDDSKLNECLIHAERALCHLPLEQRECISSDSTLSKKVTAGLASIIYSYELAKDVLPKKADIADVEQKLKRTITSFDDVIDHNQVELKLLQIQLQTQRSLGLDDTYVRSQVEKLEASLQLNRQQAKSLKYTHKTFFRTSPDLYSDVDFDGMPVDGNPLVESFYPVSASSDKPRLARLVNLLIREFMRLGDISAAEVTLSTRLVAQREPNNLAKFIGELLQPLTEVDGKDPNYLEKLARSLISPELNRIRALYNSK